MTLFSSNPLKLNDNYLEKPPVFILLKWRFPFHKINLLSIKLNKIIGKDGDEDIKQWIVNLGFEEDLDFEDEGKIDVWRVIWIPKNNERTLINKKVIEYG